MLFACAKSQYPYFYMLGYLYFQVLNEAEYYQIRSLVKALEIFPSVFLAKLEHARNEKFQADVWKQAIIDKAQEKSLASLSSTSCVSFVSFEDYEYLIEEPSCTGKQHQILVTKQLRNGMKYSHETFEYFIERLKKSDCVLKDLNRKDMDMFVSILETQLRDEEYQFDILKDSVACKTMGKVYGHGKEACNFKLTYYYIEFNWGE